MLSVNAQKCQSLTTKNKTKKLETMKAFIKKQSFLIAMPHLNLFKIDNQTETTKQKTGCLSINKSKHIKLHALLLLLITPILYQYSQCLFECASSLLVNSIQYVTAVFTT